MDDFLIRAFSSSSLGRITSGVVQSLIEGKNVLFLVPEMFQCSAFIDTFTETVRKRLQNHERFPRVITASSLASGIGTTLRAADWGGGHTFSDADVDDLSRSDLQLPQVIIVPDVGDLSPADAQKCLDVVSEWIRRIWPQRDVPALLVIAPASTCVNEPVQSDNRLAVCHLWGAPSAVDLREICRELENRQNHAEARWREMVVAGLGAGDVMLARHIWSSNPSSIAHCMEILGALRMGGSARPRRQNSHPVRLAFSGTPPLQLYAEWASGLIVASADYGIEDHLCTVPLADTRASGPSGALSHRIWRAQVEFALVRIDEVRRRAISEFSRRRGDSWVDEVESDLSDPVERARLSKDPMNAQVGFLAHAARQFARQDWSYNSVSSELSRANEVRTSVAHFAPVDYPAFAALWA
jgi:hypothetical protein